MPTRRTYKLTNAVNRVGREIENILSKRQSTRYFEGIVLMYSVMENVLKWLVFMKILWSKCDRILLEAETESLRRFCNQQDFYSAMNLALVTDLIKYRLFRRIDLIRKERNDVLHQCYLFTHRRNHRVLRAKLKRIIAVAEELFVVLNDLVAETGADDSYDVFKIKRSKQMLM